MAKDFKRKFTVELDLDSKSAKGQLSNLKKNISEILSELDKAKSGDKFDIFKNLIDYLTQIDEKIANLKGMDLDLFNKIFGENGINLDNAIKTALQPILDTPEKISQVFSEIQNKISDLSNRKNNGTKVTISELQDVAKQIKELYSLAGKEPPQNLESFFVKGARTSKGKIEELRSSLNGFSVEWDRIIKRVDSSSHSISGDNDRTIGGSTKVDLSDEVKTQVAQLEKEISKLEDLKKRFNAAAKELKNGSEDSSKISKKYSLDSITIESVQKLIEEYSSLEKILQSDDKTTTTYYEHLIQMSQVLLKLKKAYNDVRSDDSLRQLFMISSGGSDGNMLGKLSQYANNKTFFKNQIINAYNSKDIDKMITFQKGEKKELELSSDDVVKKNQEKAQSYNILKKYISEYIELLKELDVVEDEGKEDALFDKQDMIIKKVTALTKNNGVKDKVRELLESVSVEESGKLFEQVSSLLNIQAPQNLESNSGQLLKTYDQLLEIIDKIQTLNNNGISFNDKSVQDLITNLKELYATTEQGAQIDDVFKRLFDLEITDSVALKELKSLFGIDIPNSVQVASEKIQEFYNKINIAKQNGFTDEESVQKFSSEMEILKGELESLYTQGRITAEEFNTIQKTFDKDVSGYIDSFNKKNEILTQLNSLNQNASKTSDKAELERIIQERQRIIVLAEQNNSLSQEQLEKERAITSEIQKRISVQKQEKQSVNTNAISSSTLGTSTRTVVGNSGSAFSKSGSGGYLDFDSKLQSELKSQAEATRTLIQNNIENIINSINQLKTELSTKLSSDSEQSAVETMKSSIMEMIRQIQEHNSQIVSEKLIRQELNASLFSNGNIALSRGEEGTVPWRVFAESLLSNLQQNILASFHSHPLKNTNGIKFSNDMFSGPNGDIGAFSIQKKLGAKVAGISTGDVIKILDLSKISQEQMKALQTELAKLESLYSNKYPQYFAKDGSYKQLDSFTEYQKLNELCDQMLLQAMKSANISSSVLQSYDTKDDTQMTLLATRLVELSKSASSALSPVERLSQIIESFGGDVQSDFAKSQLLGFKKGTLSSADVFNSLVKNPNYTGVNQKVIDSLATSAYSIQNPNIEQNVSQIISLLNSIRSIISNIEAGVNENKNIEAIKYSKTLSQFENSANISKYHANGKLYDQNNITKYDSSSAYKTAFYDYSKFEDALFEDIMSNDVKTASDATRTLSYFFKALGSINQTIKQLELYKKTYGKYDSSEEKWIDGKRSLDEGLKEISDFYANLSNPKIIELMQSYARMAVGTSSTVLDQSTMSAMQSEIRETEDLFASIQNNFKTQDAGVTNLASTQSQFGNIEKANGPYALETTLQRTNEILGQISTALKTGSSLEQFVGSIKEISSHLQNSIDVIKQNNSQKSLTAISSSRIADAQERANIESKVTGFFNNKGTVSTQINDLKALEDGVVQVSGVLKNAQGAWESFVVSINQAGEVENLATKNMKQFSSDMNKAGASVVDYENKLSQLQTVPDSITSKLQELKDKLTTVTSSKELTVWNKEWQSVTVAIDEVVKKEQEAKAIMTAQTRINDTAEYSKIEEISKKSLPMNSYIGNLSSVSVTGMKPLADGIVEVTGVLKSAENEWKTFITTVDSAYNTTTPLITLNEELTNQAMQQAQEQNRFNQAWQFASTAIVEYKDKVSSLKNVSKDISDEIIRLENSITDATDTTKLDAWVEEFSKVAPIIDSLVKKEQESAIAMQNITLKGILKSADKSYGSLNIDPTVETLPQHLDDVDKKYKQLRVDIEQSLKSGSILEEQEISRLRTLARDIQFAAEQYGDLGKKKTSAYGTAQITNAMAKYKNTEQVITSNPELSNSSVVQQLFANYTTAYNTLIAKQKEFVNSTTKPTQEQISSFKMLTQQFNEAASALNNIINSSKKLQSNSSIAPFTVSKSEFDMTKQADRMEALKQAVDSFSDGKSKITGFSNDLTKLYYTVDNGNGTFTEMTAELNSAQTAIYTTAGSTKEVTTAFSSFFGELKSKAKSLSAYLITMGSFYRVISQVKQGIQYVRDIDGALTELKKVTDETDDTYDVFLQTASKTAGVVGSTVKDLTTMSAEWARLGYSIEDSAKLAESTALLLNVSEFDDATEASEALISTMQAFQYTADESEHVVDILNEVGNNYAVSSDGLATALQDSASALVEGGNNLEQAVALVAAANKVVQDPNSVGSALRTISLRLRGTSVEILEEMGEETDNVIESTSKLQAKIKALSGIDILTDSGDYKDTYTILKEIGNVWEDMSDIDQAALLELMAGKNRANTLSAILSNMKDLEGAYETAMGAEGSALKENDAYLDSIQGRIDLFTNSLQTMWMNFIDSDAIKFIVDLASAFIKFTDAVGVLPTLAGVFTAYKVAAKGLKEVFDSTSVSAKELRKQVSEYINTQADAAEVSNAVAAAHATETAAVEASSQASVEKSVAKTEASEADQIEGQMSFFNAEANQQEAIASGEVSAAKATEEAQLYSTSEADQIEGQMSFFNAEANTNQATGAVVGAEVATSGGVFSSIVSGAAKAGSAIKVLGVALGKAALVMAAVKVATWAIGKAWNYLDKNIINRSKYIKQEVESLTDTYEEAKKTFSENIESLSISSDTSKYETLDEEFRQLANGVDKFGNNVSLTADQYERYKEICEQIVGINPSLASGYDSATQAINNNRNALSELIELQRQEAIENAKEYVSDENLKKIAENKIDEYELAADEYRKWASNNYYNQFLEKSGYRQSDPLTYGNNKIDDTDLGEYVLSKLGVTDYGQMQDILKDYFNYNTFSGETQFDYIAFLNGYADKIAESADAFPDEMKDVISGYKSVKKDLETAQNGIIDTLLQVPSSMEEYYKLSDGSKSWITEWIKNNQNFKIDENTTKKDILEYKSEIKKFITEISNGDYSVKLDNGNEITASDILDEIFSIDTSNIDWSKYKQELQELIDLLWESIGADENTLGFEDKNALALSIGFDLQLNDNNEQQMIKRYAEIKGVTEEKAKTYFDSLPTITVQRLLQVDWNTVDKDNIDDVLNGGVVGNGLSTKTYSTFSEDVDSLNEVLSQTSEIVSNNTEITQEYKDSLTELGITEEELSDCFDKDNTLLVKNASLLRKLISQKKIEKSATIQSAKAQSQMQYKNTVKQLQQVIMAMQNEYRANGLVSSATLKTVDTLHSQLTALKQTIQQYSILELTLTDAANAYDEFENAKNRDAELSYGDSMVEMLDAINEGFKTGKTGSETFKAAVSALVPESVYQNLDDVEDKLIAIHDYIDKNDLFADYFTIDDDGNFSIAYKNIKAFVEDGLSEQIGVFHGTLEDFTLDDSIKSVKDLADAYGITEAAALAMVTTLAQFDSGWGDIISDLTTTPLDRNINDAADALDKALTAKEAFIRAGGDLNSDEYKKLCDDVRSATTSLNEAQVAAEDNARTWSYLETVYKSASGEISITQDEANGLAKSLGLIDANGNPTLTVTDDGTIQLTQEQVENLNAQKEKLSEPSIMDIQLQYDDLTSQIDELTAYVDGKINNPKTSEILTKLEITNTDEAQAKIDELTKVRDTITLNYDIKSTTSEQEAGSIEKLQDWESNGMKFSVSANTDEAQAKIDELTKVRDTITLNYDIKSTTSEQEAGSIEKLQDWESNGMKFSVSANTDEAQAKIDELNKSKDKLGNPEQTFYNLTGPGQSVVNSLIKKWKELTKNKSTNYTVNETTNKRVNYSIGFGSNKIGNVDGNAHFDGSSYATGSLGAAKSGPSLVGELGTEIIVRDGRWFTVGENGAEFTNVKKGDIIFNHKQTESLLNNGYVTGRGKAYADGTAYSHGITGPYVGDNNVFKDGSNKWVDPWTNTSKSLSNAADKISDAADEFEEAFDWVEVRLQEIDETIDLLNAKLENAVGYSDQNNIIDQILGVSNTKMTNLQSGLQEYANYAAKLLAKIPAQYQQAAQDGAIAITEFAGEADEATVDAINNYRDWADKVADLTQQIEELRTEIASLAKQKFDNVSNEYDNVIKLIENATDKLDAQVDLMEDRGYVAAKEYYESMMINTKQQSAELQKEKKALQDVLDQQVKLGNIKIGSDAWYEMVDALYEVDAAIVDCTSNLEEYQNAINDIYWDNFDELINRLDYLNNETEGLIDLMGNADLVTKPEGKTYEGGTTKYWTADDVQWTDEGIASLGLYAQQMEIAEYKAKQYAQAIDDLNKDYGDGKYSENEYLKKLDELTSSQYDAIESYYDAQDAIKNLNETRIDSIKDGIEKEIDAYQELIDKKKEELESEKDLYDFQKSIKESSKNISDIQRKLAALSVDNSASAIAQRKKLEQELAEAKADLEEQYYDRSIDDRSNALDKEMEDFQNQKDLETQKWEEYLENIEQVVADSLGIVQANATGVYDTLNSKAQEYNLTLSDAIMTPWKDGAFAVSDYQETFDTAMSSTWNQLDSIKMKWQEIIDKMAEAAKVEIQAQKKQNESYTSATYTPPKQTTSSQPVSNQAPAQKTISVGGQINAGSATIYANSSGGGGGRQYFRNDPIYTVLQERNGYILVRHHSKSSGYTGWFKKSDVQAYAKGTTKLDKSGLVNVDELGEELVLRAQNGRLTYMEKGSGVVPADMTANLMQWGQLDPREMIEQNRPSVSVPSEIKNTEINLDISYGDMLHIEQFNGDDPDEIAKIVAKQFEKHTKDLNNALRRYSR